MSEIIVRTWSRRRAERLCVALRALDLDSPPDPTPRPEGAPPEPDKPVFYAWRSRWWRRYEVHASLHWVGEYAMNFDELAWKVRHEFGAPADPRTGLRRGS